MGDSRRFAFRPNVCRSNLRAVTRVSNEETQQLLNQGVTYLDIRTEEEFLEGHVPGSLNIPFRLRSSAGMVDNPDFLPVVEALFSKDQKLLLGCKSGARSAAALELLRGRGYQDLLDVTAGFDGKRDPFGRLTPGWKAEGREVEQKAKEEQTYPYLKSQAHK